MKDDHRKTKDQFEKARQLAIRFRGEKQEFERENNLLKRENDDLKVQVLADTFQKIFETKILR